MGNISYFERGKAVSRGKLFQGDGLVSNKADFEMDVGPDREPVQSTNNFCDAWVLVRLCYRTYSVPGGLGYDVCERVLYSLQLFNVGIRYNKH